MASGIMLPTLGYLLNGNGWLGSSGLLRFEIEKPQEGQMTVVLWQGPFSRPYAQELERHTFSVTEEGLELTRDYLATCAENLNAHPAFTQEEINAFYQAKKEEERAEP